MGVSSWLLFLHVASAFAFVAAWLVLAAVLAAAGSTDTLSARALLRLGAPANVLAWVGATGTLVFGTWLVLRLPEYGVRDGWVVGAFALWLVAEEAIRREHLVLSRASRAARAPVPIAGERPHAARDVLRARQSLVLYATGAIAMAGVLVLMIFKPGAG